MISKKKLMQQLQDLGLKAGMDVLVHSSLRRVGKVEAGLIPSSTVCWKFWVRKVLC